MTAKLILEYRGQRVEEKLKSSEIEALATAMGVSADRLDTCSACPHWGWPDCVDGCGFPDDARDMWPGLQLRLLAFLDSAGIQGPIPENKRVPRAGLHDVPFRGPTSDDSHPKRDCGHCHTCGSPLKRVADGEEWCAACGAYRRYRSHGWSSGASGVADEEMCPQPGAGPSKDDLIGMIGLLIYSGRWVVERKAGALDFLPGALKKAMALLVEAGVPEGTLPEPEAGSSTDDLRTVVNRLTFLARRVIEGDSNAMDNLPSALIEAENVASKVGPPEEPTRDQLLNICKMVEPYLAKAVELKMDPVLSVKTILRAVRAAIGKAEQPATKDDSPKPTVRVTVVDGMVQEVEKPAGVRLEITTRTSRR